jgi:hypothetical protein
MSTLAVERKAQTDGTNTFGNIALTPQLGESYWSYRVLLSERQAIVGFPKFFTIGVGFAIEDDDWNTNLPYTCDAVEIFNHIKDNKGDASISDEDCVAAIKLIQDAIVLDLQAVAENSGGAA